MGGLGSGGGGGWVLGWGGAGAVGEALDGPLGVAVELEGLVDFNFLRFLTLGACWDVVCSSGEGSDGRTLVPQGLVQVPVDVLVCVHWLPEDVKLHRSVWLAQDGKVEHVDAAILLGFGSPFDLVVDGVQELQEWGDVVAVDGGHGVVGLTEPE
jgi:hypothetical protein